MKNPTRPPAAAGRHQTVAVDVAVAVLAFSFEKENMWKLLWLIPQRLVWRWLMWYVLFKSARRAIKGELQNWGVLKRTGNVREVQLTTVYS